MSTFDFTMSAQTIQALGWALGWAILHSLWIGLLIGLAFGVLKHFLRLHVQARYWLGIVCLLAFSLAQVAVFVRPFVSNSAAFSISAVGAPSAVAADFFIEARPAPTFAATRESRVHSGYLNWTFAVALAWLFGVVISAFRLVRSHHALNLLARNAHKLAPSHVLFAYFKRVWQPLIESLDLPQVRFAISELIDVPCVIGSIKPIILMPAALLARLPVNQLELVLIHELSHIKNGDLWINSGQIALEVLMFYHPIVHWISADVRATRERRCDQAVLALRATPVSYANTLLSLEEFRVEFRGELHQLALAATGGELSVRVREILAVRTVRGGGAPRANMRGIAVLSFAVMVALAGAISSAYVVPQGKPTEPLVHASDEYNEKPQLPANSTVGVWQQRRPDKKMFALANAIAPNKPLAEVLRPATQLRRVQNVGQVAFLARKVLRPTNIRHAELGVKLALAPIHLAHSAIQIPVVNANTTPEPSTLTAVRSPRVLARVQPVFAPGLKSLEMFSLSFSLNAAGKPQAIQLAAGRASQEQLRAAQTALTQWQFDPEASAKYGDRRLTQSFSFQEISATGRCAPRVGTRICR
jgi:bla regulator protein blaR1